MVTLLDPINSPAAATSAGDAELLRAFRRTRDDLAFGRLVARHAEAVRAVALRQTGNLHAAEDVAQATFLVLSGRLGPATRSAQRKGSLRPWLLKVCGYCAANWRRAESRRRRREHVAAVPERVDPSQPGELTEAVAAALSKLGRRDRRLIELHHLDEKPWPEVAADLNLTPAAAKRAGSRAMERLRASLDRRGITATSGVLLSAVAGLARPARAVAPTSLAYELAKGTLLMLKLNTAAVTVAALAAVAGLTGGFVGVLAQTGSSTSTNGNAGMAAVAGPTTMPAAAAPGRAPLAVKFADGVTWNLVALGDGESAWRLDGTPADEPSLRLPGLPRGEVGDRRLPTFDDGRRWLALLVVPANAGNVGGLTAVWAGEPLGSVEALTGTPGLQGDERIQLVAVPGVDAASLLLTAPISPWLEVDSIEPDTPISSTNSVLTGVVMFGQPAELDGSAVASMYVSNTPTQTRLVAHDKAGKRHDDAGPSTWTPAGQMFSTKFADLALKDVERFAAQRRSIATAAVTVAGRAGAGADPKVEAVYVGGADAVHAVRPGAGKRLTQTLDFPLALDNVPLVNALSFIEPSARLDIEPDFEEMSGASLDVSAILNSPMQLSLPTGVTVDKALQLMGDQTGADVTFYVHRDGRVILTARRELEGHRDEIADDPQAAVEARRGHGSQTRPAK